MTAPAPERPLNVLLPWSLASYVPLNGFHPLYRSLASIEPRQARLLVPRPLSAEQYRQAILAGLYAADAMPPTPAWACRADRRFNFRDYALGHVPAGPLYAGRISADVELHHTAPVTAGHGPSSCSSNPSFPCSSRTSSRAGPGRTAVEAIRRLPRGAVRDRNCLALTSHVQSSLDQFSDFFRSAIIDRKLVHLRNGLDPSVRVAARRDDRTIDFLFPDAPHQHPASFAIRGGIACLVLALDLLAERQDVRFYFRTRRPDDDRSRRSAWTPIGFAGTTTAALSGSSNPCPTPRSLG